MRHSLWVAFYNCEVCMQVKEKGRKRKLKRKRKTSEFVHRHRYCISLAVCAKITNFKIPKFMGNLFVEC